MGRLFANFILFIHSIWVFYVIISAVIWPWYPWLGLVAAFMVLGTTLSFKWWNWCPLTELERNLRKKYDKKNAYTGSCIYHYIEIMTGIRLKKGSFNRFLFVLTILSAIVWHITENVIN